MSRRYTLLYIIPLLASLLSLFSCQSDDPVLPPAEWRLAAESDKSLCFASSNRYYQFVVRQEGAQDTTLAITTDAEWLSLTTDRLPADGIVEFYATANKSVSERSATIRFTSAANPEHTAILVVRQQGISLTANNDGNDNPQKDYGVGWGFNAYQDFQSSKSVVGKVINEQALQQFDSDTTFNSFQESVRGRQSFEVYSAHSLQEMSSMLTRTTENTVNILFYKKTTKRFEKISTYSTAENLFAYARLTSLVASRSMDKGVIEYLVGKGETSIFTPQFKEAYDRIIRAGGTERPRLIQDMLTQYGTHIVTEASLGGMIDYAVTFDRNVATTLETTSENYCNYFFGRRSKSESDKSQEHVTSTNGGDYAINISGGESKAKEKLLATARNLGQGEQLNADDLQAWAASINSNCLYDEEHRADLDIVDFHFLPIWKIFADKEIQNAVLQQVIEMGANSNHAFTDEELGTDNYLISNIAQYDNFGTSPTATLVKVLYNNNVPIIEICNEYVPKIRTDKRITVFYPIKDGRTRIGQGIFPGDGEGNPPSSLTFSDGDCYVDPIDGYGYNDRITKLYYLHGNLYSESYGTTLNRLGRIEVRDHYLSFNKQYAIVKIGFGYWTRTNIQETMWFDSEYLNTNSKTLYAEISLSNENDQFYDYLFGPDEMLGKRSLWYLPKNEDIFNLRTYIGKNCKSLFRGQVSGFDAQFAGYYGIRDDMNGRTFPDQMMSMRYQGAYCFIASKQTADTGAALILSPNYTLSTVAINNANLNWYPVRLFRTSSYQYYNI